MVYYILVKRKISKNWLGAIPAKKGVSKALLQKITRKNLKAGWSFKIISETELKRFIKKKTFNKKTKKR